MARRIFGRVTPPASKSPAPLPTPAELADPDVPEDYVIEHVAAVAVRYHHAAVAAVMSRPGKSAALLGAIIHALPFGIRGNRPYFEKLVAALLSEPSLSADNLRYLVHLERYRYLGSSVPALCLHPAATADTLVYATWNATDAHAKTVAWATGSLLPAASCWVRAELGRAEIPGPALNSPSPAQRDRIVQVAGHWGARSRGNPALRLFLATASFDFTDADDLFAAGAAICAPRHA